MVMDAVNAIGHVPLPPYIRREDEPMDKDRYQTVFAASAGAVAAPTAGLHFTDGVIGAIKEKGVEVHYVTLHTGAATFMPVRVEDIRDHTVPEEFFEVDRGVYGAIERARGEGRRVIAVGSTVTRALETVFKAGQAGAGGYGLKGGTDLFIYPPFEFRAIKGLLTNFHLPASSLLMLVSAFAGRDNVMAAYREAVKEGYRFYSYGDAMLIV
jgi:S-adenosylmethionine:tRNA ribosyltransferase-isomerase